MFFSFKFRRDQFFQNLNTILFLIVLSFFITPSVMYSQENIISSIVVEGNQRITTDTIVSISKIEKGNSYSPSQLNSALQLIKKSTYFKTVTISQKNNILKINVIENPTINSINFEGNDTLQDENLFELITSKERQTLSASKAEKDADIVAIAYADMGRIAATVTPKIVELSDNRVDLILRFLRVVLPKLKK